MKLSNKYKKEGNGEKITWFVYNDGKIVNVKGRGGK